jgi:hypothetical protein
MSISNVEPTRCGSVDMSSENKISVSYDRFLMHKNISWQTAVAVGVELDNQMPHNEYFEYFGPEYNLHISPSSMANKNTKSYLDSIRFFSITVMLVVFLAFDLILSFICEGKADRKSIEATTCSKRSVPWKATSYRTSWWGIPRFLCMVVCRVCRPAVS